MSDLELYTYFRSSAAYRVRIALNLKGLDYTAHPVHLLREGGENYLPGYRALNPQAMVPTLVDAGQVYTQSLAIIEYLEERHPDPPLLPASPQARARVRALSQAIACDIHPLNNTRVKDYLQRRLDHSDAEWLAWYRHWIEEGFEAIESLLADSEATGRCCHGNTPTLADVCLVPQMYNARRFQCDLSGVPTLVRIADHCQELDAFKRAAPENQPDAE